MRQTALSIALALAAASAAVPAAAQMTDPRLEAFKAACLPHRGDAFAAVAALHGAGWTLIKPGDNATWDALLVKRDAIMAAEALEDEPGEFAHEAVETAWTKDGYIVSLSRSTTSIDWSGDGSLDDEDPWVHVGCNLYDFAATSEIPVEAMTAWTASLPVQSLSDAGMTGHTYNVFEMMRGTAEIQIAFVSPDSSYVEQFGFPGVAITMSTSPEGMTEAKEEAPSDDLSDDDWMNDADDEYGASDWEE